MIRHLLEDKNTLFEKINQVLPDAIYIYSLAERTLIWFNDRHQDLYGYTLEEVRAMAGKFPEETIHPDDLPHLLEQIQHVLTLKDNEILELEYRFKDRQGHYHWMNDRVTVFARDNSGQPCSVLGVAASIDERKSQQEALTQTLRKLNLSLSAAHMGTWEWDQETEFANWDAATYELHGETKRPDLTPYQLLQTRVLPEDLPVASGQFVKASRAHQDLKVLYRVRLDSGDIRYIRSHGRFIDGKNSKLYGVSWDVTEEIRSQQQIEEARVKMMAGAKMAALGEMSGGIAHEINNPLTVIQARAFQLAQMVENQRLDAKKIAEAAESISRTADKIARIIKSMRSFSREGSTDPFETVVVRELIGNALEFCQARFYHHGIDVQIGDIDDTLEVECRLVQIEQVLLNLLNNSYDAIEKSAEKWIRIEAEAHDGYVDIKVTDSGPGIPSEMAENILLPFFTTKEPGKGTGLGLSIASGIVKSHNGDLFLLPQTEHTTFVVRLPRIQQEPPVTLATDKE